MEKMNNISLANRKFIEDNSCVISYYVNSILESRMILDEDMNLILTFWDPSLLKKRSVLDIPAALISTACTTIGLLASLRFNNLHLFALSCVPAGVQLTQSLKRRYMGSKYKNNFAKFISSVVELYELNRSIMEYCHKRDSAMEVFKNSNEAYSLLLHPGEQFLKNAILVEVNIVENLKTSMSKVSNLVPVTEGEYIYSVDWNLDEFSNLDLLDFKDLQWLLQKLSDFYVLLISNFLGCLGLSFCFQLWKDASCNFKLIFDQIVPNLNAIFETGLTDIKTMFNSVRFTLHERDAPRKERQPNNLGSSKELVQLKKSLGDFLGNIQLIFETGKHLQLILIDDENTKTSNLANYNDIIDDINTQLVICEDSLDTFLKFYYMLTKRSLKNETHTLIPPLIEKKITKQIRYDDPLEPIEDEEYNLSIHGSEEEEEIFPFIEYADQVSTEHLELMLHELKLKLNERKGIRNEPQPDDNKNLSVIDQSTSKINVPPAPPLLAQSASAQLPVVANDLQLGFLDALKSVTQRLNREEEFQFGFNMFPDIPRPFNTTYSCFSVAMLPGNERQDVERGGKIIMPPSALEQLTRLNINYPMLFKITNKKTNRITHCGVLEFVADEGKVYLPLWMMHNLVLEESDLLQIESVSLPVGKFAKFQPLSPDFLDITNPKAVLENCLRTFACLTSGDVIAVKYNQRVYELCVLETQPGNAISIIECDMNVEFAAPVGYKETEIVKNPEEEMVVDPADLMPEPSGFVAFRGAGNRLDGKRRKDSGTFESSSPRPTYVRGIPDYDYEIGTLRFLRHLTKSPQNSKEENGEFKAFSGEGFSLKRRN